MKLKCLCFAMLLLSLFCTASFADVEINSYNFPDDIFRNFVESVADTNQDGTLTAAEASSFKTMNVSDMELRSIKGIEYFTALVSLDCSVNSISILDLSGNTSLEYVNCHDNQIFSLTLNGCTKLSYLDCSYCNIMYIDLADNTALEKLLCWDNELLELDLRNNTSLKYIDCNANNIASLDVSNLSELETIDCRDNKLPELDLSENLKLIDARAEGQVAKFEFIRLFAVRLR